MEFSRSSRSADLYTRQTERLHRQLVDSGMSVFALTPSVKPAEDCFGGLETSGEEITVVRVLYGPWAEIETARGDGAGVPLRPFLEQHVQLDGGRCADLAWTEITASVLVDGRPVPARLLRAGERWWAARCAQDGVEITVVGVDWRPAVVAVETMSDFGPMLDQLRAETPLDPVPREAVPPPGNLGREPHLVLADAVLRNAAAQAAWLVGGGPAPQPLGTWSSLWQAAVRRQVSLSDEPEPVANHAVSTMMAQIAALYHEAVWFRTDDELRRRAIAEVLLHGTELGTVASRAAQQAWQRRALSGDADFGVRMAADEQWLSGWQAWAADQRRR